MHSSFLCQNKRQMQWQICIPKIPGFYFSSLRKLVRHTNSQIDLYLNIQLFTARFPNFVQPYNRHKNEKFSKICYSDYKITSEQRIQHGDTDVFGTPLFVLHRETQLLGYLHYTLLPIFRRQHLDSGPAWHNCAAHTNTNRAEQLLVRSHPLL